MRSDAKPRRPSVARELDWRLRSGSDQIAVDDSPLVDVVLAAGIPGHSEILGGGARVSTVVKYPAAGEAGGRAADRGHRDLGPQEAFAASTKTAPPPASHISPPARMSTSLSDGSSSARAASGSIRTPPMVVMGLRASPIATTSKGSPVKRPVRRSTSRRPTSESLNVSKSATWAVRLLNLETFPFEDHVSRRVEEQQACEPG